MRLLTALLATGVVLGTAAAVAPAAGAAPVQPGVSVSKASGLRAGTVVTVTARGLPASTEVDVAQCEQEPQPEDEARCTNTTTATTDETGRLRLRWTLLDPVYWQPPYGDPVAEYCRADACRMFVTVPGGASWSSEPLRFHGSPATISVSPSADLVDGQRVRVTGTAKGSAGRRVQLVQQACLHIIQGSSCNGQIPLGTVRLTAKDTFAATVPVSRFLPDGQDCTDMFFENCRISAIVLDAHGQPDDTFGVARLGDPGAYLSFAPVG